MEHLYNGPEGNRSEYERLRCSHRKGGDKNKERNVG